MDSSAVFVESIAHMSNVPRMKRQIKFASTLYAALNKPSVKVEDIAKWHWQIANYMYTSFTREAIYSVPIDPKCIFLDARGDILDRTCVVPITNEILKSDLFVAKSILNASETMLDTIEPLNYTNKIKIYRILAKYVLYTLSKLEKSKSIVATAFFAVENLCNLVDDGVIDDINKISELNFKELTI